MDLDEEKLTEYAERNFQLYIPRIDFQLFIRLDDPERIKEAVDEGHL